MNALEPVLHGAVAMGQFIAFLFFLRFWMRTRDVFFALFSVAFLVEAINRTALACFTAGDENEPLFYIPRLVAFGLIAIAVLLKNNPKRSQ